MKKAFALILALILVLGTVGAFAEDTTRRYVFVCPLVGNEYFALTMDGIAKADEEYGCDTQMVGSTSADQEEAVGVSKFYLSRLFKLRLGTNYSTYLTEKRVHMAASLIEAQRELSNREIAERVGFRDPDYFGKVFKRAFGCTVSEYREKNYEAGNRT